MLTNRETLVTSNLCRMSCVVQFLVELFCVLQYDKFAGKSMPWVNVLVPEITDVKSTYQQLLT